MRRFSQDKRVGSAQGKRKYDLPLNKSPGTGFLILLIGLMTFLAVMAIASSFALGAMTSRWSSGLENRLTIEIAAEKSDGQLRSPASLEALKQQIAKTLKDRPQILNADILSKEDTQALISPWLGDDWSVEDIPLPGLISVELSDSNPETVQKLGYDLKKIDPDIRVDTHETWLNDLLKLTGALQFSAALITLIIGITTVTAIAGAIRSRMAIHAEDVQLLHLMGASDEYISKQFQRHALIITLQGAGTGMVLGFMLLLIIYLFSGDTAVTLIPDFHLSTPHILTILSLPALACLIAGATARFTVLRVLARMP